MVNVLVMAQKNYLRVVSKRLAIFGTKAEHLNSVHYSITPVDRNIPVGRN